MSNEVDRLRSSVEIVIQELQYTLLERDNARNERDEARAALERVRAVVERLHYLWRGEDNLSYSCSDCGESWPCPTIQAFDTNSKDN